MMVWFYIIYIHTCVCVYLQDTMKKFNEDEFTDDNVNNYRHNLSN